MTYVYVAKFNISLTRLDMYTSSTEPPPPPGPSSTAGNELLCVVCRLIIHIGHNFMHYITYIHIGYNFVHYTFI